MLEKIKTPVYSKHTSWGRFMFFFHQHHFGAVQKDCVGKVCLCVVLQAKKPVEGKIMLGGWWMPAGSAFRNGRNCQRYVGVDRASGLQMMRFDKLGFNALIEVYENFLFFDCKFRYKSRFICRWNKKESSPPIFMAWSRLFLEER